MVELCSRGVTCRAIVRHVNPTIAALDGAEIVHGDPAVFGDLLNAATGCDCIVHIASITDQSLLHYRDYQKFNVGSVENVVAVARAAGIRRIVYVSSANTIGNGTSGHAGNETTKVGAPFSRQLYARSKIEAEAVLRAATDIEVVVLNPTFMLGSYDSKPSSGAIIAMGYHRRVVWATCGGKNIVNVMAVAGALCNAIEVGRPGENYLLSGVDISVADFFRELSKITGFRSVVVVVPRPLVILVGYVGDFLRFCGVRTQVSSINMRVVCEREHYNAAKARRELALADTDLGASIVQATEWLVCCGILRR